jgi:histone deacetylase 1/2
VLGLLGSFWKFFFATKTKARMFQLTSELHSLEKGDLSISDFIHKAKTISINLASAGKVAETNDLLSAILNGLGSEYDPIIATLMSTAGTTSYEDAIGVLLSHEQRL